MKEAVSLMLIDRNSDTRKIVTREPPINIGRHPKDGSKVVLSQSYSSISRQHAEIRGAYSGLIFTDTSSNGSKVNESHVHNESVSLHFDDKIFIGSYEIRFIEATYLNIILTDSMTKVISTEKIAIEEDIYLIEDEHGLQMAGDIPFNQRPLARLKGYPDRITIKVTNGIDPSLFSINNMPMLEASATVEANHVLAFKGQRIEVLQTGSRKLVCGNNDCQLLNDAAVRSNCRWCGRDLAAVVSKSRYVE